MSYELKITEYKIPPFTVSSHPVSGVPEYEVGKNYPNPDGNDFIFLGYIKGTDTPMWKALSPKPNDLIAN